GGHDGAPRIAKDNLDALVGEDLPDDLCAGSFHGFFRSSVVRKGLVTAPSDADETSEAYLAITPRVKRGGGGVKPPRRAARSASTSSLRAAMSKITRSPSRTKAIGPPSAASGATCPAMRPCVAPLKRPSVISATESPSPRPTSAAVTASISRIP